MSIFDRAKRAAKANIRSALGRLGRTDPLVEEARRQLEEDSLEAEFETFERDPELVKAYRRLELPYGADRKRIDKAFRKLLDRYHPDRFGRDPDRAKLASEVTRIITEARDSLLEAWRNGTLPERRGKKS